MVFSLEDSRSAGWVLTSETQIVGTIGLEVGTSGRKRAKAGESWKMQVSSNAEGLVQK